MLRMGLFLAAILVPVQLFLGHLNGEYVHDDQPAKFAAIEARWHDEQPAAEVLIALPDVESETNRFEIKVPYLGSLIASLSLSSKEVGLADFPKADRPPIAVPFFAFRVMVGCGLLMLAIAWLGAWAEWVGDIGRREALLWATFLSFPLPFVATLTGWFTAEVGRQPWAVYGLMRTSDAVTPHLTDQAALSSLIFFGVIYLVIFSFGSLFIYRLLRAGPSAAPGVVPTNAKRPLALAGASPVAKTLTEKGAS